MKACLFLREAELIHSIVMSTTNFSILVGHCCFGPSVSWPARDLHERMRDF